MPSTSVELYDRLRIKIEQEYSMLADERNLRADSPWRHIIVDHGEVKMYCENKLKEDGFIFLPIPLYGFIMEPEKYKESSLPDDITDYLQYIIEEWDFALTTNPAD